MDFMTTGVAILGLAVMALFVFTRHVFAGLAVIGYGIYVFVNTTDTWIQFVEGMIMLGVLFLVIGRLAGGKG